MIQSTSKTYISLTIISLFITSFFILVSQSQQLYQHDLTMHRMKSNITQLIYSPWFILTVSYNILKHLMKYQSSLKNIVYITRHFQFQFIAKDTFPSTYPEPKVHNFAIPIIAKPCCSTYNQHVVSKNLPMQPKTTTTTTTTTTAAEKIQMKQVESEPTSAEWIVVTEKKKNARTVVKEEKPKTKAKKTNNNNNNNKQNKIKSAIVCIKPKSIIHTTPVSSRQPWSNVVKTKHEEEELIIQDDLPSLSDNESTTGSIESPCLSYKDLNYTTPSSSVVVEEKYYSPFSTGFDFGVFSSLRSQHDESLDKYLCNKRPQSYYTNSVHKNSILNLLNQTDQVETTITPTCFKYFDDMMMSTSLYPKVDDTNYISFMDYNKKDWEAINYIR